MQKQLYETDHQEARTIAFNQSQTNIQRLFYVFRSLLNTLLEYKLHASYSIKIYKDSRHNHNFEII